VRARLATGTLAVALAAATAARAEGARPAIESPQGVPVHFESNDRAMEIFIARGEVAPRAPPSAYEKLPTPPVTVRLDPGTYTVEAESPTASTGHQRIFVEHDAPMTVDVRGGDVMVKLLGGVCLTLGIVSTLLGVVAVVAISPHDSSYNRWGVGLPLLLGGAGVAGLGVGLTALGSTNIDAPRFAPGGSPKGVALAGRF
jgi:hypothetical protein